MVLLFFFVLKESGELYVWGINDNGELGIGKVNEINSPKRIDLSFSIAFVSCGYYHTAIISGNCQSFFQYQK
jgi:X-linked retinitis pigmentosa GTPase regulator